MPLPEVPLAGLSPQEFLDTYWQKKPVVLRGALPAYESPVTPNDLMDLATRDDAESRLILEEGGEYPWQLFHGPFEPEDFDDLPEGKWTVLVQEVDRLVPEVAALLNRFRFVPSWRVDDVMVSYAPEGGGVGAHVDNYDVFLIQASGSRRWRFGHQPIAPADEVIVEDLDISMLAQFEADEEVVLEAGDLLYLPPRVAHDGASLSADCMTFSVGFRAPSEGELAASFLEYVAERTDPHARYNDPDLRVPDAPGELPPETLHAIRARLAKTLALGDAALADWFGRFVTEPRRGYFADAPDEPLGADAIDLRLETGASLVRTPGIRWSHHQHADGSVTLFADGEAYPVPADLANLAALLTGTATLDAEALAPHLPHADTASLLASLHAAGAVHITEPK